MLATAIAAFVVVATSPGASEAPRLLVMDLKPDKGVDPQMASTLTDFLAAWVGESKKFSVTSKRELTTLADLEAQRQEADCESSDVCVSDLADALGARFVVFGRVGKLGESFFVHVTLADAKGEVPRVIQLGRMASVAGPVGDLNGLTIAPERQSDLKRHGDPRFINW